MNYLQRSLKVFDFEPYSLRGKFFYKGIADYREKILPLNKHRILPRSAYRCALCGDKNGDVLVEWRDEYQIIECRSCSFSTANFEFQEFTSHVDIAYNNDIYYEKFLKEIVANYEYRKKNMGRERYSYVIERLGLQDKSPTLLDIGCGAGWFLSYLKDLGVQAKGLEVNPMAVRFCQERGLNVQVHDVSKEPEGAYDVITMFDVLEHLTGHIVTLGQVNRCLKPGGYLVAYTPNIHSVAYELMGSRANTLLPFEHTGFFDEKSFEYLADKTGFVIHSLDVFGFDIMDYLLMKEYEDGYPYTEKLRPMMFMAQAVIDELKIGNHYRITLRKPDKR